MLGLARAVACDKARVDGGVSGGGGGGQAHQSPYTYQLLRRTAWLVTQCTVLAARGGVDLIGTMEEGTYMLGWGLRSKS